MMMLQYNKYLKYTLLFLIGGFAYGTVEIMFRGFSHVSMLIAGGLCFVFIGWINEDQHRNESMSLISQMLISAIVITMVEFAVGLIVNVWLGLDVWDYSNMPYNFMGQICLLYMVIWFFLSLVAIFFDEYLRCHLLREEKRHYKIL